MNIDSQVIKRYLEGEEQPEDRRLIIEWFSKLEAERDLLEQYQLYWNNLKVDDRMDHGGYDGEVLLGRLYHRIKLEESRASLKKTTVIRLVDIVTKIAAVLLIPAITFSLLFRTNISPGKGDEAYSEIYSPLGTRTMFYLPDGSQGWLNGDSYLKFPTVFRGHSRNVKLRGEAYFDVAFDKRRDFTVSGAGFEVVAHGTAFNILAYPEEKKVSVTLVNGNVEVFGNNEGIMSRLANLKPDQICVYDMNRSTCSINQVDANKIIAWKEGKLVFRNEPFSVVVSKINRWYNVNLIIKDKELESQTYLATFEDETLDEVLKLLKLSAPITYKDLGRERGEDGSFHKRQIEIYYQP